MDYVFPTVEVCMLIMFEGGEGCMAPPFCMPCQPAVLRNQTVGVPRWCLSGSGSLLCRMHLLDAAAAARHTGTLGAVRQLAGTSWNDVSVGSRTWLHTQQAALPAGGNAAGCGASGSEDSRPCDQDHAAFLDRTFLLAAQPS